MIPFISILLVIVLVGILMAACGSSSASPTTSSSTAGGSSADGLTLLQQRCSHCHSVSRVTSAQKTAAQWKSTVDKMVNNGAQLTPAEEQTLVNYLAQNYHP
jgi:Quinohemoprotein amine dehydrogenase A, alpha subunit, haem binding